MSNEERRSSDQDLQKIANLAAQTAAEQVVRVAAQAAEQVTLTATHAAAALHEITKLDMQYIKADLKEIKDRLANKYVTCDVFDPIRNLVYGLVGLILVAVVGGVLAMVLKK